MRPINKGKAPNVVFDKYQDAQPHLEERLGPYCSFCEFPIKHVPEVEHKEAKAEGGEWLQWDNLLLSCKYCNTRKGTIVKKGDKEKYLWPDEDDTFHVYSYASDIPELAEIYLKDKDSSLKERAENLFKLIKLNNIPVVPSDKDRRYRARCEAHNYAKMSKEGLQKMSSEQDRKIYLKQIQMLAKESGFFSTWMSVFDDDIEVKQMLIATFNGTKEEYCKDW